MKEGHPSPYTGSVSDFLQAWTAARMESAKTLKEQEAFLELARWARRQIVALLVMAGAAGGRPLASACFSQFQGALENLAEQLELFEYIPELRQELLNIRAALFGGIMQIGSAEALERFDEPPVLALPGECSVTVDFDQKKVWVPIRVERQAPGTMIYYSLDDGDTWQEITSGPFTFEAVGERGPRGAAEEDETMFMSGKVSDGRTWEGKRFTVRIDAPVPSLVRFKSVSCFGTESQPTDAVKVRYPHLELITPNPAVIPWGESLAVIRYKLPPNTQAVRFFPKADPVSREALEASGKLAGDELTIVRKSGLEEGWITPLISTPKGLREGSFADAVQVEFHPNFKAPKLLTEGVDIRGIESGKMGDEDYYVVIVPKGQTEVTVRGIIPRIEGAALEGLYIGPRGGHKLGESYHASGSYDFTLPLGGEWDEMEGNLILTASYKTSEGIKKGKPMNIRVVKEEDLEKQERVCAPYIDRYGKGIRFGEIVEMPVRIDLELEHLEKTATLEYSLTGLAGPWIRAESFVPGAPDDFKLKVPGGTVVCCRAIGEKNSVSKISNVFQAKRRPEDPDLSPYPGPALWRNSERLDLTEPIVLSPSRSDFVRLRAFDALSCTDSMDRAYPKEINIRPKGSAQWKWAGNSEFDLRLQEGEHELSVVYYPCDEDGRPHRSCQPVRSQIVTIKVIHAE